MYVVICVVVSWYLLFKRWRNNTAQDGVEAIAKLRIVLDNGVHQGVHHHVEDDGREGVTLVDSKLKMDRGRGP